MLLHPPLHFGRRFQQVSRSAEGFQFVSRFKGFKSFGRVQGAVGCGVPLLVPVDLLVQVGLPTVQRVDQVLQEPEVIRAIVLGDSPCLLHGLNVARPDQVLREKGGDKNPR